MTAPEKRLSILWRAPASETVFQTKRMAILSPDPGFSPVPDIQFKLVKNDFTL